METPKTGADDDDMGVVGAEADDAEAEFIRNVRFYPNLIWLCLTESFPSLDLREGASVRGDPAGSHGSSHPERLLQPQQVPGPRPEVQRQPGPLQVHVGLQRVL